MYVYIKSEPQLFTVGHYDPAGEWEPESDHGTKEEAAARVNYLNGGKNREFEYKKVTPSELNVAGEAVCDVDLIGILQPFVKEGWEIIGITTDAFFLKRPL